jgi:hypothetical protein
MFVTYADACAIFERMTPAEQAEILAEARAKGTRIEDLIGRGIAELVQLSDRDAKAFLRNQHRESKRPSTVLLSVEPPKRRAPSDREPRS